MKEPFKRGQLVEVLAGEYAGQVGRVKRLRFLLARFERKYYGVEVVVPPPPPRAIVHHGHLLALRLDEVRAVPE